MLDAIQDRAAGAVMGGLVGDALGVGPHWYYDLDEMRRDYGNWIDGYTDPLPDRYHAGLKAGQLSQAGIILRLLLQSVVEKEGYDEEAFCRRLDEELFPHLDGKPMSGPGGYTSQSIREAWRRRVRQNKSWKETGGHADTTEAAERALVLSARYAGSLQTLARTVVANCVLTQADEAIVAIDGSWPACRFTGGRPSSRIRVSRPAGNALPTVDLSTDASDCDFQGLPPASPAKSRRYPGRSSPPGNSRRHPRLTICIITAIMHTQ